MHLTRTLSLCNTHTQVANITTSAGPGKYQFALKAPFAVVDEDGGLTGIRGALMTPRDRFCNRWGQRLGVARGLECIRV